MVSLERTSSGGLTELGDCSSPETLQTDQGVTFGRSLDCPSPAPSPVESQRQRRVGQAPLAIAVGGDGCFSTQPIFPTLLPRLGRGSTSWGLATGRLKGPGSHLDQGPNQTGTEPQPEEKACANTVTEPRGGFPNPVNRTTPGIMTVQPPGPPGFRAGGLSGQESTQPSQSSPRWPLSSQKLVPKEARAPSTGHFLQLEYTGLVSCSTRGGPCFFQSFCLVK